MGFIASGSYDLTVRVWDTNSKSQVITIPYPEAQINCLSFVPNGTPNITHIAIGTWQKLKIFDISQATQPVLCPSFEGANKNITACGFDSNRGQWMFTGGDDGNVRIFDMTASQRQHVSALTCHNALEIASPITSVVLHLNGIELFIADQAGQVHIWDLSKQVNKPIDIPELGSFEFVVKLAVHPNGTILSGITNRGNLLTWRLSQTEYQNTVMETATETAFLGMAEIGKCIGLSLKYTSDGRYLIVTLANTKIVWLPGDNYPDYENHFKNPIIFEMDCDWNWDTLVTRDSRFMFTGGSDGKLKIWNVETQSMTGKLEGHQKGISAMAISEFP